MRVGFLGCGKIGRALLEQAEQLENVTVAFVQDLLYEGDGKTFPVIRLADERLYESCDLIVECAMADVLKENTELILKHCDLMPFSVTAFAEEAFLQRAEALCRQYGRRICIPHGAILGLDGIFDGNRVWESVRIETVKNPKSLGRADAERTVVFEGPAREGCRLYPRNVNVHAAVALAGIGFDRTVSQIVSDPAVNTNSHTIYLEGEGISMKLCISSFTTGGVTGLYTPYSACGSLRRVLENGTGIRFV